jgi:hypothetical protein
MVMLRHVVVTISLIIGMLRPAGAADDPAKADIEAALTEWTVDFNRAC